MVGPATDETAAMANAMSETWLAFARTGNPNNPAIPEWRPYDLEKTHGDAVRFDVGSRGDPHRETPRDGEISDRNNRAARCIAKHCPEDARMPDTHSPTAPRPLRPICQQPAASAAPISRANIAARMRPAYKALYVATGRFTSGQRGAYQGGHIRWRADGAHRQRDEGGDRRQGEDRQSPTPTTCPAHRRMASRAGATQLPIGATNGRGETCAAFAGRRAVARRPTICRGRRRPACDGQGVAGIRSPGRGRLR